MTRKRRIASNRFLPEFVSRFQDRHGKERLRYRRAGYPSGYFKSVLGTEEFRVEYQRFNDPQAPLQATLRAADERVYAGSVGDLQRQYYAVPERLGPTETTQQKVRSVLDRGFFKGREDRPIKSIGFDHIDAIISERRARFINKETGRREGGVEAARKLRKELVRLFHFAEKKKLIVKSPMDHVSRVKVAPGERSKGYHNWNEQEIAVFRERHPVGTKARLAMELVLWTDQRGIDSMHLGRQHIKNGRFEITQSKTGKLLILPIAPQLLAAIVGMPKSTGNMCFIFTEENRPFSRKGFGNKFRQWCDEAGLRHCAAHGLRKATMRRMADLELPNKSMKSVSGHSKDDEVARYTAAADQERLARRAIKRVSDWEAHPPPATQDAMAQAAIIALAKWDQEGGTSNPNPELDIRSA